MTTKNGHYLSHRIWKSSYLLSTSCWFDQCIQFPSPNFLVIDEGLYIDTDNLSNMKGAFDYLKTRFNSVFIISHLDTIKDFMDYLLPINKTDKHSNVTYI